MSELETQANFVCYEVGSIVMSLWDEAVLYFKLDDPTNVTGLLVTQQKDQFIKDLCNPATTPEYLASRVDTLIDSITGILDIAKMTNAFPSVDTVRDTFNAYKDNISKVLKKGVSLLYGCKKNMQMCASAPMDPSIKADCSKVNDVIMKAFGNNVMFAKAFSTLLGALVSAEKTVNMIASYLFSDYVNEALKVIYIILDKAPRVTKCILTTNPPLKLNEILSMLPSFGTTINNNNNITFCDEHKIKKPFVNDYPLLTITVFVVLFSAFLLGFVVHSEQTLTTKVSMVILSLILILVIVLYFTNPYDMYFLKPPAKDTFEIKKGDIFETNQKIILGNATLTARVTALDENNLQIDSFDCKSGGSNLGNSIVESVNDIKKNFDKCKFLIMGKIAGRDNSGYIIESQCIDQLKAAYPRFSDIRVSKSGDVIKLTVMLVNLPLVGSLDADILLHKKN